MNYKKLCGSLTDLVAKAEIEDEKKPSLIEPYKRYGLGTGSLIFRGTNVVHFLERVIKEMWEDDKVIHKTVSMELIEKKVIGLVKMFLENGEKPLTQDVKKLIEEIMELQVVEFEVFKELYGVDFYAEKPLEFGPFKIYNRKIHEKIILTNFPHAKFELYSEEEKSNTDVLISVVIPCREQQRAIELADILYKQFQNIIRFMIADPSKNYDIGIFDFYSPLRLKSIVFSNETAGSSNKLKGAIKSILIHKFPINDIDYGHDKIWRIIASNNPSDLENRIIAAIEWVGKGLRDEDFARGFIQIIFALESLLSFQQKETLVTPSITSQLAEFSAFIIGRDYESKLNIERLVKQLYSRRSAVAHGGSSTVSIQEFHEALWLLKQLVTTLLTDQELVSLKKIEELTAWVKKQKYS